MKWIVGSLAVLASVAIVGVFLSEAFFDPCDVVIRSTIRAPGSKVSAVVFEKECGATVPFNTQVTLAPEDRPFSPRTSPAFLIISGKRDVLLRWIDGKAVEITIPPGAQIFKSETSVGDVRIEYK